MNILETIVAHKKKEVATRQSQTSINALEKSPYFERTTFSLKENLSAENSSGIIAEFKRKSPSKGWIHEHASPTEVTQGYQEAGVAGLSVLTDEGFFGAKASDFDAVRKVINLPMLRKDFMIDEYQIIEAKAMGADVVLLIAACLDPKALYKLAKLAHSLHLEVLLEVHDDDELQGNIHEFIDLVGVNNRNLKTFEVSIDTSLKLTKLIPEGIVKISESGLSEVATLHQLKAAGYQGFLMGENFMKTDNPGESCAAFIKELKQSL